VEIGYTNKALKDIEYWKNSGNKKIQDRIVELLKSIEEDPFKGIGKPEPLRFDLAGYWSRRVDKKNRIVYSVEKNRIIIISVRFHYDRM
jgi:toxin YoeB